jgi:hypothetical protein
MSNKYIGNNGGVLTEVEASSTSSGAADAGKIVALNSQGDIDESMLPPGVGADTAVITASEDLGAGDYVNVYDNTGTANVRLADASSAGKEAHGFVLAAVTSGNPATVYFEGTNNQVTGQTAGKVFLSATTPGATTSTAPSGTGKVVQRLGVAVSATAVNTEISQPIVLA